MSEKTFLKVEMKEDLCKICKVYYSKFNEPFQKKGKCIYATDCFIYDFKFFEPVSKDEAMKYLEEPKLKKLMSNFKKFKVRMINA